MYYQLRSFNYLVLNALILQQNYKTLLTIEQITKLTKHFKFFDDF